MRQVVGVMAVVWLVLFAGGCVVARPCPCTGTTVDTAALERIAGVWDTSEGQATWEIRNGKITGPYSQDGGRVFLDVDGHVARGIWVENDSNQRCDRPRDGSYHWGRVELRFGPDFQSFEGWWSYCESTKQEKAWTGRRVR
ncbi:MAG: hypothetical protein D6729_00040 [Deltaproteobacteria bacterium]|nr:MAG: hypothetical protein D6729_00040 [Deltaproteobacteria bacterium]